MDWFVEFSNKNLEILLIRDYVLKMLQTLNIIVVQLHVYI